jgi:hypothetical protein
MAFKKIQQKVFARAATVKSPRQLLKSATVYIWKSAAQTTDRFEPW